MKQRVAVWLLAFYTVIIGGLATTAAPVVAVVFYVLLVAQILVHTFWLCPRCGNYECAINPNSPYFILGKRVKGPPAVTPKPMNTTLPVTMLGLTIAVGLYAVWQLSPIFSYALSFAGIALVYGYSRVACRTCQNKCPLNKNPYKSDASTETT